MPDWIIIVQYAYVWHPSLDVMVFVPHKKTFCYISALGLGPPVTPFQITHSQRPNVHPMFYCVKKRLLLVLPAYWRQIKNLVPFLVSNVKS